MLFWRIRGKRRARLDNDCLDGHREHLFEELSLQAPRRRLSASHRSGIESPGESSGDDAQRWGF